MYKSQIFPISYQSGQILGHIWDPVPAQSMSGSYEEIACRQLIGQGDYRRHEGKAPGLPLPPTAVTIFTTLWIRLYRDMGFSLLSF